MIRWPSRHALAGAQIERHARPAPVVDPALEGDEGLGVRFRIDALLLAVADVLAAHDVGGVDRQQRAEHLVLLLADRARRERGRRLHRHEGEDLEEMGDDHVAIGAGLLVEADAVADIERLGHVDLDVVDEVAVPDRLEQAVAEAERQNVLRRLLAEEMVDAEDLVLGEHLVQFDVERDRALEVGAERLLHDHPRALGETGLVEHPDRRQRRARRHAEIVDELDTRRRALRRPARRPPSERRGRP